ncbi:hypothetical protein [Kitasatospora azatica]|uniref:hypothetical protein n=1 Tax=Kitasatospora azatica TaxID=58347 RepID=UPI00055A9729|nr:hypothetical protein [Kitasatospora azatica]
MLRVLGRPIRPALHAVAAGTALLCTSAAFAVSAGDAAAAAPITVCGNSNPSTALGSQLPA